MAHQDGRRAANEFPRSIADELQLLCDEVAEFTDCCARLCDGGSAATAGTPSGSAALSATTNALACWMKERMSTLHQELARIQKKVATDAEL